MCHVGTLEFGTTDAKDESVYSLDYSIIPKWYNFTHDIQNIVLERKTLYFEKHSLCVYSVCHIWG